MKLPAPAGFKELEPCPVCRTPSKWLNQTVKDRDVSVYFCPDCRLPDSKVSGALFRALRNEGPMFPEWHFSNLMSVQAKQQAKELRKMERKEKKVKEYLSKKGVPTNDLTDYLD